MEKQNYKKDISGVENVNHQQTLFLKIFIY